MTEKEKYDKMIEKGYIYNSLTGEIYGLKGKAITSKCNNGYIRFVVNLLNSKSNISGHRFAYYFIYKELPEQIDHIDGNRLNNSISNLRDVNNQQNCFNRTKAKGYSFNKERNRFRSRIKVNNKLIHLGYFELETDARNAYLDAKKLYHNI